MTLETKEASPREQTHTTSSEYLLAKDLSIRVGDS